MLASARPGALALPVVFGRRRDAVAVIAAAEKGAGGIRAPRVDELAHGALPGAAGARGGAAGTVRGAGVQWLAGGAWCDRVAIGTIQVRACQ